MAEVIIPNWPAPAWVKAASTTRRGGVSQGPFASLNLGYHTRDNDRYVSENRARLAQTLGLPATPVWLKQVHGNAVIDASLAAVQTEPVTADASFTSQHDVVCAVMTADCVPLLLCDRRGRRVAAVHAGWRGLRQGVIAATVAALACASDDILAWLGPAIGPRVYEVGDEVRAAFLDLDQNNAACFRPSNLPDRWLADLYALARRQLGALGVSEHAIFGGEFCTYSDPERFFSYRRDGSSGRLASLIWMA